LYPLHFAPTNFDPTNLRKLCSCIGQIPWLRLYLVVLNKQNWLPCRSRRVGIVLLMSLQKGPSSHGPGIPFFDLIYSQITGKGMPSGIYQNTSDQGSLTNQSSLHLFLISPFNCLLPSPCRDVFVYCRYIAPTNNLPASGGLPRQDHGTDPCIVSLNELTFPSPCPTSCFIIQSPPPPFVPPKVSRRNIPPCTKIHGAANSNASGA
jgi:hypothetical protein